MIVTGVRIDEALSEARDMAAAAVVGEDLCKAYPGYRWYVNAQLRQGIIDVRCGQLHGGFGFTIKVGTQYSASSAKADALRYAGELLERGHVSRVGARDDELMNLKRDLRGQVMLEI